MSDERPDKCPTCGIAREHDGPHYRKALKQAGKPMCPDPFHDPAPKPQGLDAVSGDGTWDEADERYAAAMNAPRPAPPVTWTLNWRDGGVIHIYGLSPADGETVECVPLDRLREVERELQKCKRRRESWKAQASKYRQRLDIAHTRCDAALSELARTKRQLNTLREAVGRHREWSTRGGREPDKMSHADRELYAALASLDEQGGSDE